MNNFIFNHRNKDYGAYAIRQNYNNIVTKSLLIATAFVFTGFILTSKLYRYNRPLPPNKKDVGFMPNDTTIVFTFDNEPKKDKEESNVDKKEEPEKTDPPKTDQDLKQVGTKIDDKTTDKDLKIDSVPNTITKIDKTQSTGDPSIPSTRPTEPTNNGKSSNESDRGDNKEAVIFAEVMQEFPDGNDRILPYLTKKMVYPNTAVERGIEQKFSVRFIVDETGKVVNPEVLTPNVDHNLANEAKRVLTGMPKWKPGKSNGRNVKVYYVVPFQFSLKK